jgi:hypothetical protein
LVRLPVVPNAQPVSSKHPRQRLQQNVKIVPQACTKLLLDKAVAFKTCVPAIQEGLLQLVLIVRHTRRISVWDALVEKLWCRPFVQNVLPVKLRLNLMVRVMHARKASTKIKTAHESRTVVKIVVPEHTAIKTNKYPPLRVKFALLDVGHLPSVMVLALVSMAAQPATWANTTH